MHSPNLYDAVSRISTSLALLAQQVSAEARAGMTTRNKLAESILLPILHRVYGTPDLASTSAQSASFPGIDLSDRSTGLGIQISSDTRAAKITEAIATVLQHDLPVRHLVIVFVADKRPKYRAATKAEWRKAVGRMQFDPDKDIVDTGDLLRLIQALPPAEVIAIADDLDLLIQGKRGVDILAFLVDQSRAQLTTETSIGRYIPDVFVEKVNTKYHARCFAHPTLFLPRVASWMDDDPYWGFNLTARKAGLPGIQDPVRHATSGLGLAASTIAASELGEELAKSRKTIDEYTKFDSKGPIPAYVPANRTAIFEELRWVIGMQSRGFGYKLEEKLKELECLQKPIFMLIGRAGQGKTNFLCDFVDRFMLRHGVPCAYITARQLNRLPEPDLTEAVRKLIFPPSVANFDEGMTLVDKESARIGKPFVIVIDGLNEHRNIAAFAGQLEHFLLQLVRYPSARTLLTCRSEFFHDRFGILVNGELAGSIHLSEAHGQRIEDEEFEELVDRYFAFFQVDPQRVSESVLSGLQSDILMLRFFCEAYGARGRPAEYKQPQVTRVYRDAIFGEYLRRKLSTADETASHLSGGAKPVGRGTDTREVLTTIAKYMVENSQYSDVPSGTLPVALHDALYALLDEELILRRDAAPAQSVLSTPTEVINFTFDALRDYILAQYLVDVYRQDYHAFDAYLAKQRPTATQSLEGMQQFLFYAARDPENAAFFSHYRSHSWYAATYDTEVFQLQPDYLVEEDRDSILALIRANDDRSIVLTQNLAIRWRTASWPILNLELLLEVANASTEQFLTDVLQRAFGRPSWQDTPTLNKEFCEFAIENLDSFDPQAEASLDPVFRLIVLLLPIDQMYNLESPGFRVVRRLTERHPEYATGLLVDALNDRIVWNQPFIWRALTEIADRISAIDDLRRRASARLETSDEGTALQREINRFLDFTHTRAATP